MLVLAGLAGCTGGGAADSISESEETLHGGGTSGSAPTTATAAPGGGVVLVMPETGRSRLGSWDGDGSLVASQCMADLFPVDCSPERTEAAGGRCHVFGAAIDRDEDGDRVVLPYVRLDAGGGSTVGGIVAFTPGDPPRVRWTVESVDASPGGLQVPHRVLWWDADTLLVADTRNHRLLWLLPGEPATVVASLGVETPGVDDARNPNDLQLLEHDGRRYLLVNWLEREADGSNPAEGQVHLWDVTDPAAPVRAWRYPAEGYLAAPHHARRVVDPAGRERLIYAHSLGASDNLSRDDEGSIGTAAWSWTGTPVYQGDALLEDGEDPLGFVRSVEPTLDGEGLLVTDSGCMIWTEECPHAGRLLEVGWPEPAEDAGSGSWTAGGQTFLRVGLRRTVIPSGLVDPFETVPLDAASLAGDLLAGRACP